MRVEFAPKSPSAFLCTHPYAPELFRQGFLHNLHRGCRIEAASAHAGFSSTSGSGEQRQQALPESTTVTPNSLVILCPATFLIRSNKRCSHGFAQPVRVGLRNQGPKVAVRSCSAEQKVRAARS